ncbi:MAG: AraC family transcriptional regulator [Gemmatimonadetes bacterium]|nr:AraC family transcriptional regulator [Gemmatimonadota bacterium]
MQSECFGAHEVAVRGHDLLVSRTRHDPALRTPAHAHPVACLHVVLEGLYDEHTRAGRHQAEPGWGLFKPSGEVHWNEFRSSGSTSIRVELHPDSIPDLTRRLPNRLTTFRAPRVASLARRAHRELCVADELTPIVVEALAIEILTLVARMPSPGTNRSRALARRCADLLDRRFSAPYRLGDAARELGVHRTVLARAFRREFDCTIGEYIRHRRVAYVASHLRGDPRRSLGELALDAGFCDQSHLTRSFKAVYGCPPGEWRRRLGSDSIGGLG